MFDKPNLRISATMPDANGTVRIRIDEQAPEIQEYLLHHDGPVDVFSASNGTRLRAWNYPAWISGNLWLRGNYRKQDLDIVSILTLHALQLAAAVLETGGRMIFGTLDTTLSEKLAAVDKSIAM